MINLSAKKVYLDLINRLLEDAKARSAALTDGQYGGDTADLLLIKHLSELRQAFEREEIGQEFEQLFLDNRISGLDVRSLANQSDFVAGAEKASTARYRSRVQHLIYGAARDAGQSEDLGYISLALRRMPVAGQDSE